ncbi:hypothetical protein RRF57_009082 [Xylaria bambusicola]|uniref:Uncharacterized protein n=1 Tax=Xylaria bambusicola TaxID=326684 RepID=A0AAN7UT39_9PEZI
MTVVMVIDTPVPHQCQRSDKNIVAHFTRACIHNNRSPSSGSSIASRGVTGIATTWRNFTDHGFLDHFDRSNRRRRWWVSDDWRRGRRRDSEHLFPTLFNHGTRN